MPVKVMLTTLLSESLVHVIFGAGLPLARHFSVMFPPSVTVWFPEISVMFGGTAKEQRCVGALSYYLQYMHDFLSFLFNVLFCFSLLFLF